MVVDKKMGEEFIFSSFPSFILIRICSFLATNFLEWGISRGSSQVKVYLAQAIPSSANASRNFIYSPLDRLVAMISRSNCFMASTTLSLTASLVSKKRAEVPSVTLLRTDFMKSSSIPTFAKEPVSAPSAVPAARPAIGTKKRMPNSKPQLAQWSKRRSHFWGNVLHIPVRQSLPALPLLHRQLPS